MPARVHSFVLRGIDALPCEIEADISPCGPVKTTVVGLPDAAVKESAERVRTAMEHSGCFWPQQRIIINLAPADLRKEGPVYDLPVAVALLSAQGRFAARSPAVAARGGVDSGPARPPPAPATEPWLFAGELALDGRLRPVRGAISMALLARRLGRRGVIVPAANAAEASVVEGIEVIGAASLLQVLEFLGGLIDLPRADPVDVDALVAGASAELDFADVRGQEAAKRAMTIAAAGSHNILLIGPAGTGKTMMARALPGILPPLTRDECLEATRIHSCVGALPRGAAVVARRPVRTPHHTASVAALVGGGSAPRPGEVSLAHRGVLFLDELPEFSRLALEALREPLEDGHVTIARANAVVRFPARVMLVAAMNPTQRGGGRVADVAANPRERYLSRLSGPLVDRIDLHVEVAPVPFKALAAERRGTDSASMRARVLAARGRQARRQPGANAALAGRELDAVAPLDPAGRDLVARAMAELGLSARAYDKIRRVARTIADLEESDRVRSEHVAEAVQYRLLDRQ